MLMTVAAFFFVLSIVVFVHELGHFSVAKLNRICVTVFSFGFGPKLLRKKVGETEYAVSALPFGGYVKFAGELGEDEGGHSDLEVLSVAPERLYRNKPPAARMSVVLAGPAMNFVLALLVYVFALYIQGVFVNPSTVINEIEPGSPADSAGLKLQDRVIAVEDQQIEYWMQAEKILEERSGSSTRFTVLRGSDTLIVSMRPRFDERTKSWRIGVVSYSPARIGNVKKGSPADKAGLRPGASILSIEDTSVTAFSDLERRIRPNAGKPLKFVWEYEGKIHEAIITPSSVEAAAEGEKLDVVKEGQIGVGPYYRKVRISFLEACKYGWQSFAALFRSIISFLGKLFTGKATVRAVGGPIRVGIIAGDMLRWGFSYLVYFLAFFSLNLAIFNLLPILPFDGGHFVLSLAEIVTRRRMSKSVQQKLAQVGFVILVALMAFVLAVDMFNIFR